MHVVQPRSLHPKVLTATFFFLYEYLSYTHVTLFTAFSYIIFDTDNRLGPTRPPLHTRDGRGKERNRNRNIWSEKNTYYICAERLGMAEYCIHDLGGGNRARGVENLY